MVHLITYSYGFRRLPDSMREWVANDLAGPGAVRRFMLKAAIPPFIILAPFWLLPVEQNSVYVHAEMTVPLYLWTLAISLALNKVWRRHRLAVHGLDPNLVDVLKRKKNARMEQDYIARFGPRPADAERQKNSNPFF
ncbi:DUF5313 domain-containing protein [Mycolicibacterium sp. P1-5]|uniref:DUF5313 domain-containing protein n=1 Tax=Mycolicibacterium sp. P1-5 TaxID=2024617 RepID=UPI0011F09956|nr:DUF5313 domain-containing protein [Mycolicibacterium sp. P1-5]KAA0105177.1 hypothetical protein CIW47_19955 [Mycolicibacterium sp. P1-5]